MIPDYRRFVFDEARIDGPSVSLNYRLCDGTQPDITFTEKMILPVQPQDPDHPAIQIAMRDLHIACGISYWKTCCPPQIQISNWQPTDKQAAFWEEVYTHGLGEFFFRNDRLEPIMFPKGGPVGVGPTAKPPTHRDAVLLLVGGGKDSVVAREVLRHAKVPVELVSLGTAPWIKRSAAAMGDPYLTIKRQIDPTLFALNDAGALNGHIPISAIIAFATRLLAVCAGHNAVISANERSASHGNISWRGMEINHQWSKSARFESLFADYSREIQSGPVYLSLLRPLSELAIGACFARHPRYFDHVTSCNANFRVRPGEPPARWCGTCPKCVFVYSILAPHLSDEVLNQIFGSDILSNPQNKEVTEQLLGLTGFKPFECVGTPEEVRAALGRLRKQQRLNPDTLSVIEPLSVSECESDWTHEMKPSSNHIMPPQWQEHLFAYLRSH